VSLIATPDILSDKRVREVAHDTRLKLAENLKKKFRAFKHKKYRNRVKRMYVKISHDCFSVYSETKTLKKVPETSPSRATVSKRYVSASELALKLLHKTYFSSSTHTQQHWCA